MKFTKEFPKRDGYYYVIDINYPAPLIVFCYERRDGCWMMEFRNADRQVEEYERKYLRWGDEVFLPECKDIEYE